MKSTMKLILPTKTQSSVFCALFLLIVSVLSVGSTAQASVRSEAVETVVEVIARSLDDAGKVALRKSLKEASLKYGDDVLKVAERGGLDLVDAASRHGDEVWRLAKLSPKAPKALAARAEEILSLSKRYGDDAVRVEIKAPQCGEILTTTLSKKSMSKVAEKASSQEIKRFTALAVHRSPKEVEGVVKVWSESGSSRFLKYFTPGRIAAGGLASAIMITAWKAPESSLGFADTILKGFFGPAMMVCSWIIVLLVLIFLRRPLIWMLKKAAGVFKGKSCASKKIMNT